MKRNKGMGKLLALLLCAALALGLAACGEKADDGVLTVGIVQLIENGAFNDMREGFVDYLRDNGYPEEKLVIDYKNAQGDISNLNVICQDMVNKKVDLVVAIATPASQAIVNMDSGIPVVFISVSNPVGAGIITDMGKPDKNATGTSNAIPIEAIFDLANDLTPGLASYGLLYNTGEINSVTTVNEAKEYMVLHGIAYEEAVVSNSSEVQQAAQVLAGKVDAIFVPNDSMIQNAMPLVAEIAREAGIPVYGSSAVMVDSGAFATVAISDREIGAISAEMAVRHFEGAPIGEIPAVVVPADDIVINRTTADILGVEFSPEIEESAIFLD